VEAQIRDIVFRIIAEFHTVSLFRRI
jgi:hypothetical protein